MQACVFCNYINNPDYAVFHCPRWERLRLELELDEGPYDEVTCTKALTTKSFFDHED